MKEYDLFIPLHHSDGSPIEAVKIQRLQARLLEHFSGVTFFPQVNQGLWQSGGVTDRDEIVIFRVVSDKTRSARQFLKQLKGELQVSLDQEEVFIIERDVERL